MLIPYRSSAAVELGITRTRDSLRALVDRARARGALPLIVVPQFGPEMPAEETLRRRILDETGLPYLQVRLDRSWHLPGDLHPDPRAAQAIAIAIAERLRAKAGNLDERNVRNGTDSRPMVAPYVNTSRSSWSAKNAGHAQRPRLDW
jgi:hypothetical protein